MGVTGLTSGDTPLSTAMFPSLHTGRIVDIHYTAAIATLAVDTFIWQAPAACVLQFALCNYKTAGGTSAACMPVKVGQADTTTAISSGTDMLSAAFDLTAAALTQQAGTLHATPANYTLAAGDKIALKFTGTQTNLVGLNVTLYVRYNPQGQ